MTTGTDTLPPKQMTARLPTSDGRFPFMHARDNLKAGDVAEVTCSHQCTIMLMDDENLAHFIDGHKFHYYGGLYEKVARSDPRPNRRRLERGCAYGRLDGTVRLQCHFPETLTTQDGARCAKHHARACVDHHSAAMPVGKGHVTPVPPTPQ